MREKNVEYTEFEQAIVQYLRDKAINGIAARCEIAQGAFPEKWAKRSGRGALIGHIDRIAYRHPDDIGRIPPRDRWGDAMLFMIDVE